MWKINISGWQSQYLVVAVVVFIFLFYQYVIAQWVTIFMIYEIDILAPHEPHEARFPIIKIRFYFSFFKTFRIEQSMH